jgi:hypothetical protein
VSVVANQQQVGVNIVATTTGLDASLKASGDALTGFKRQIEGAFGSLGSVANAVRGPLIAITGLLAGGALFKSAIDYTQRYVGEVKGLSKALGVSLKDASAWRGAMSTLGVEVGTVTSVTQRLTMMITANERKFRDMGISTRDLATGALRPMASVLQQVSARVNSLTSDGRGSSLSPSSRSRRTGSGRRPRRRRSLASSLTRT